MVLGVGDRSPPHALGLPVCICRLGRGLAALFSWSALFITWWKGWLCHPRPGLCPLRMLGHCWDVCGVMPCSAMGWCQRCSWLRSMCCFPKHVSPSANGLPGWERFGLLCLTWASQLKEDMFSCGSYTLSQLPFHAPATAVNHDGRWN